MIANLFIKIFKKAYLVAFLLIQILLLSCSSNTDAVSPPTPKPQLIALPSSIGIVGDTTNVNVPTTSGTVLMGGAYDVDSAMKWMINKSTGGDVVILRASGSTGYNQYLYDLVKINNISQVNSVETLLINNTTLANNPKVAQRIKQAEMVFIAGGDQANYINYWKNTLVEDAINYLINTKKIPIGGTSAGCAIMGDAVFTAENGTITSTEALDNPYNSKLTLQKSLFLNNPFLTNTITDTHYNNPDRKGRHTAFLARLSKDFAVTNPKGIGVEEETAVCIDQNGKAIVYGIGSAYFLLASSGEPETCANQTPLHWYKDKKAVKTYVIQGSLQGNGNFDLNNWTDVSGGIYKHMYSTNGLFTIE